MAVVPVGSHLSFFVVVYLYLGSCVVLLVGLKQTPVSWTSWWLLSVRKCLLTSILPFSWCMFIYVLCIQVKSKDSFFSFFLWILVMVPNVGLVMTFSWSLETDYWFPKGPLLLEHLHDHAWVFCPHRPHVQIMVAPTWYHTDITQELISVTDECHRNVKLYDGPRR
jgi:hypothetical protein